MEIEQSTQLWNWPEEPVRFIPVWEGAEATGYAPSDLRDHSRCRTTTVNLRLMTQGEPLCHASRLSFR